MSGLPPDHDLYARAALPHYGRDPDAPLRLLSLSENATYLVDDAKPIVLRVHRADYHSLEAIRSELAWMAALREETDVVTPQLVAAADGSDVVTAVRNDHPLNIDAVSFVSGCTAEARPDAVGFDQLGHITATMHDHVQGWEPPDYFTRFSWDAETMIGPQARWGNWRHAPGLTDADEAVIERAASQVQQRLAEFGCAPDRFGLVHADLRMANLMIDPEVPGGPITVIDFDDCGWSWHLADLGAVVSFIEDTPEAEAMIAGWLAGYRARRKLPDEHLAMIPTFVILRRLQLTAWVASHAHADSAIAFVDGFAEGTARLAQRYLDGGEWLRGAIA
ncbi:phosphotransferase enzyme family protein [Mycobacterium sp. 1274761.0]|uniref:phosphotransferase enzyme family protein n=1 Tax=Mycobacterium sp. 1274761.0 TaxID=1834077 RepID=UPI0008005654|nr:phosphotransferase [Mycobacterium sp. 1274761.0]OBK79319.1 aminoglycoside phosphotransferase [Mycobacterium sp. 1274761.0]